MLTIIIGVGLFLLFIFVFAKHINSEGLFGTILVTLFLLAVASLVIGLIVPLKGYKEPELIKTIELVSLSNSVASTGKSNLFYTKVDAENVYTYRERINSPYTTDTANSYELKTVSKNVIEVEDKNCTKPELKIYKKKAKKSIWSFALFCTIEENVFYVPEGTISHQVNLE